MSVSEYLNLLIETICPSARRLSKTGIHFCQYLFNDRRLKILTNDNVKEITTCILEIRKKKYFKYVTLIQNKEVEQLINNLKLVDPCTYLKLVFVLKVLSCERINLKELSEDELKFLDDSEVCEFIRKNSRTTYFRHCPFVNTPPQLDDLPKIEDILNLNLEENDALELLLNGQSFNQIAIYKNKTVDQLKNEIKFFLKLVGPIYEVLEYKKYVVSYEMKISAFLPGKILSMNQRYAYYLIRITKFINYLE